MNWLSGGKTEWRTKGDRLYSVVTGCSEGRSPLCEGGIGWESVEGCRLLNEAPEGVGVRRQ